MTLALGTAWAQPNEGFATAIEQKNVALLRRLVAQGQDPNALDQRGETALTLAIRENASVIVDGLLELPGLDVNRRNGAGESPLMLAAHNKDARLVGKLLQQGAEVNQPGWTALHYAAAVGAGEIVELLLAHHAYIDAASPNQTTPLMMAARAGDRALCKRLIEAGADPTVENQSSLTAEAYAQRAGDAELAEWLGQHARNYTILYKRFRERPTPEPAMP